ncbi:hypothetical protein F8M41_022000 [Gigaspora margarita]|uniref:Uncharacterized protein n=1 Tax=Gigaspora margarita TaxID=4874 RepID=A0A8H4AFV7_GIGMA|nr:hypothetical protein F8M41_022000 [Gigaspora margarita]
MKQKFVPSPLWTGIIQNKYAQLNISEEYLAKDARAILIHTDLHLPLTRLLPNPEEVVNRLSELIMLGFE